MNIQLKSQENIIAADRNVAEDILPIKVNKAIEETNNESLDESHDEEEQTEESTFFKKIKTNIQNELAEMTVVYDHLNKLREEVANLECDLMARTTSSTWTNISELIGMPSTTMIDECMKILDHTDMEEKPIGTASRETILSLTQKIPNL